MKRILLCLFVLLGGLAVTFAVTQDAEGPGRSTTEIPNELINYDGFLELGEKVGRFRGARRAGLADFLEMARDPETIVLDTRSKAAFDRKHLKGAVHLNFSDFTEAKLKKVIPDPSTRILIYCNNNFKPSGFTSSLFEMEPVFASKGPPLALNIPTFINLVGYGYENVYELGPVVEEDNPLLVFAGTDME